MVNKPLIRPCLWKKYPNAVDGSEIRRSPVEVGSFNPLFATGFSTIPGGSLGFLNHQQYRESVEDLEFWLHGEKLHSWCFGYPEGTFRSVRASPGGNGEETDQADSAAVGDRAYRRNAFVESAKTPTLLKSITTRGCSGITRRHQLCPAASNSISMIR